MSRFICVSLGFLVSVSSAAAQAPPPINSQAAEFFETKIRPVLAENCFSCHGPKKQQANLRLDSREALLKGSENGPVIVPGQPEKSLLHQGPAPQGELRMPPRSKLAEPVIADIAQWIKIGVPWPATRDKSPSSRPTPVTARSTGRFSRFASRPFPPVKNQAWVQTPIDAFILAKLEAKGLDAECPRPTGARSCAGSSSTCSVCRRPSRKWPRSRRTNRADAYAKLVDRYLASPHYGERWARHWLDVARYADTKGYVFEEERRYAFSYTYRDWVIRAFNEDLPYDQFILHQLAADRLVAQGKATPARRRPWAS